MNTAAAWSALLLPAAVEWNPVASWLIESKENLLKYTMETWKTGKSYVCILCKDTLCDHVQFCTVISHFRFSWTQYFYHVIKLYSMYEQPGATAPWSESVVGLFLIPCSHVLSWHEKWLKSHISNSPLSASSSPVLLWQLVSCGFFFLCTDRNFNRTAAGAHN